MQQIRISQEGLELALDEEMPEPGKKKFDEQLGHLYGRGVLGFRAELAAVMAWVRHQVLLLRGERGAGKSVKAAFLANELAMMRAQYGVVRAAGRLQHHHPGHHEPNDLRVVPRPDSEPHAPLSVVVHGKPTQTRHEHEPQGQRHNGN